MTTLDSRVDKILKEVMKNPKWLEKVKAKCKEKDIAMAAVIALYGHPKDW